MFKLLAQGILTYTDAQDTLTYTDAQAHTHIAYAKYKLMKSFWEPPNSKRFAYMNEHDRKCCD